MLLKLRILFTVLSAICLFVIIPAAVWGGFVWLGVFGFGALLFFVLMLICKQAQEEKELKEKKLPPPPPTDEKEE